MPRQLRTFIPTLAIALTLPALAGADEPKVETSDVTLKTTKFEDVLADIGARKGKVVVVDIWGFFCVPCKKEFPHLVELHKKYDPAKVACVSVSVDPEPARDYPKALGFLKKMGATFTNYLLDERPAVWQDHYDMSGPPAVFVYDQNGKLQGRFMVDPLAERQYTYEDVERLVEKLLKSGG